MVMSDLQKLDYATQFQCIWMALIRCHLKAHHRPCGTASLPELDFFYEFNGALSCRLALNVVKMESVFLQRQRDIDQGISQGVQIIHEV